MTQLSGPVTILAVDANSGVSKKTGKPYTMFKIKASDGNTYDTFDGPTAQEASAAQQAQATVLLEHEVRLNGQYTNYDLKGVRSAAEALVPVATPIVTQMAQAQSAPAPAPVASDFAQKKEERITRLSAAGTAFEYAGSAGLDADSALELAWKIEEFAHQGLQPRKQVQAVQAAVPASSGDLPWPDEAA